MESIASSAFIEASTATSEVSRRTRGGNGGERRQLLVGSFTFTLMEREVGCGTHRWSAAQPKGRFWGALIFLRVPFWDVGLIRRARYAKGSSSRTRCPGAKFVTRPEQLTKGAAPKETAEESLKQKKN